MKTHARIIALTLLSCTVASADDVPDQPLLTMDEDVWVMFYDLPSRRFRSIRDSFLRRDFELVARDLEITSGFLRVEAERAVPELRPALEDVVARLDATRSRLTDTSVTVSLLDGMFARAHWLLSQHYLVLAMQSREMELHRNAGRYLAATAHHLERAVLWSNARISTELLNSLESIRDMSSRLQSGDRPERVYRERPLRLTARTLTRIGEHLDRTVRIEELLPE